MAFLLGAMQDAFLPGIKLAINSIHKIDGSEFQNIFMC